MINFKVRLKQKWFWITLIPLLFLFADKCYDLAMSIMAYIPGEALSGGHIEAVVIEIVGLIFMILVIIGFPVDLTTNGYGDSLRALERTEPGDNAKEEIELIEAKAELEDMPSNTATDPELPDQEPAADLED